MEWRCLSLRDERVVIVTEGDENGEARGSSGLSGAASDCASLLERGMVIFLAPLRWHRELSIQVG